MDWLIGKQSSETDGYTGLYLFSCVLSPVRHRSDGQISHFCCALPLAKPDCCEASVLRSDALCDSALASASFWQFEYVCEVWDVKMMGYSQIWLNRLNVSLLGFYGLPLIRGKVRVTATIFSWDCFRGYLTR